MVMLAAFCLFALPAWSATCASGVSKLCTACASRNTTVCEVCSATGSEELGDNVCAACGLGRCLRCKAGTTSRANDTCEQCAPGYTVIDGHCVPCDDPVNGIQNCTACKQQKPNYPLLTCTACANGSILRTGSCASCSILATPHCAKCEMVQTDDGDEYVCTACEEHYKMTRYGYSYICKAPFTTTQILGIIFCTLMGLIVIIVAAIVLDVHIDKL